ncbi:MAG: conjugal transfer protein TraG N-terminal domain-containing protein, partial [Desulfurococcaceae archaeon]
KKFGDLLFSYVGSGGSALTPGVITATQTTTSSFIGAMIHANSWIPAIKETMRAFSVVIAPIVLLFIVTPLFGRALGVIFGMQIWLLLWAVIDVVITGFSLSLVRSIGQSGSMLCPGCGPNVIELTAFPSMAMKVYAILGMMRWAGIGLATFISGMLIRFGGTVLAMVAGQIAGAPMGAGSQAGVSGIKDPHGYVGSELVPRMAFTNAAFEVGGFRAYAMGRIAGATFMEASGVSSGLQTMTHTGGSFSGVASAGLSAGTVGATQNIASAVQGEYITAKGGPGIIGTGLGRLGAIDVIAKGLAGLKFSPGEVLSTAENSAPVIETNVRIQARHGQVIKGREKEIAEALGLEKGLSQIAAYLALRGHSKAFNELLKTGMDPIDALQMIGKLRITEKEVDDIANKGKAEMDKAKQHGYSEDFIRSNINNEKFAKELSDKGIDVESLRKFVDMVNAVASLGWDINKGGLEKLKDSLRLHSLMEGMRLSEGEKEARFRQRGEGWQDLSKDPDYAKMEWYKQHEFVALTGLSSVLGQAVAKIRGVDHINIPGVGLVPVGISDLNYQDNKAKRESVGIEHSWTHKLSALEARSRERIYSKMAEISELVKKYAASKDEKLRQHLEVGIKELVELLAQHGFSREQILDIIKYSLRYGGSIGIEVGAGAHLGGGGEGGGGGRPGVGAGIGGKVTLGGRIEKGRTRSEKDREKADLSGSFKDQIDVSRFRYRHSSNFVDALEHIISGAVGRKFTFSESIKNSLVNSFESAVSGKEAKEFSEQESLNKSFRIPDPLISKVYNQALKVHGDPLKALRDTYIVATDPQLAAKYLEMSLLNPAEAKKFIEDYLNRVKNHVEDNISNISNNVPSQEEIERRRGEVEGRYNQLKNDVVSGLNKRKEKVAEAEKEAKEYEKKKEEQEKEILKENLKIMGSDGEPKIPPYSEGLLEGRDKDRKIREQYTRKPPDVSSELPEFPPHP